MALIGEMQYLTIGGNTYSIPTSGGSTVTVTRSLTSGTKTATISVDGTSYDLYAPTPNVGTITSVKTTAGAHTAINVSSGAANFNVPTKTSHLTNDSGFLTGITSSQVTTALGYTPYNSTNPNGYTSNTGTVTKVTAGTGLSIGTTAGGNFTTSGTINHTNSVTAQTTQAVYPIKIDAQGHISAYGSAVTIPTVPSNIVNTITTTAGTHTTISSATGAVSFNVPTKTSHLTNDSGFITSSSLPNDYTPTSGSTPGTNGLVPAPGAHSSTDDVKILTDDGGWTALASSLDGSSKYPPKSYAVADALAAKQATLVSGTNIKTINNESILGSGNITISGGGSYTATSPIDITNDVISHETSGVTAGTYDGGASKDTGIYFPSFTVDAKGHITSATDLGTCIPVNTTNSNYSMYACLLTPYSWAQGLREYATSYSTYVLSAGQISKTITISSDYYSAYQYYTNFRVVDVICIDKTTSERVIVDWTTSSLSSAGGSITLTVSSQAYTNDIAIFPILSYGTSPM